MIPTLMTKRLRRYLGDIGLANWKRARLAALGAVPECGWAFAPNAQGKGYCSEALSTLLNGADEHLPSATIALIGDDNPVSLRVAERKGLGGLFDGAMPCCRRTLALVALAAGEMQCGGPP